MQKKLVSKAYKDELFKILRSQYPEGIARVAAEALFWSQYAEYELHGRLGIYKTNCELGKEIGRHGQTAGTNLMKVCSRNSESTDSLFEVKYGPLPYQHSGRCRWLFITSRGRNIIQQAIDDKDKTAAPRSCVRHRGNVSVDEAQTHQPAGGVCVDRRPGNASTLTTTDCSNLHSKDISSLEVAERNIHSRHQEGFQEEVLRIPILWETACVRCKRVDQVWRSSQIQKFGPDLREIERLELVRRLGDKELLDRLILLCDDLAGVVQDQLSDEFKSYNKSSLSAQSFAQYGEKLLTIAGAFRPGNARLRPFLSVNDL